MSEHAAVATQPTDPVTVEEFLTDRQHFWSSFTHFVVGGIAFVVILLILMAIFLV
jgi:hypothetical protein